MNLIRTTSERLAEAMQRARRHWQSERQSEEVRTPAHAAPHPFTIAISRQAGASGALVARTLGVRLGWPVYDHELLQHIAGEMGVRTRLLESVDEKRAGWLRECLERFVGASVVNEAAYRRQLVVTLFALAAHGNCVLVGRGAAQVLPAETTLRVRLVGLEKDRIGAVVVRRAVDFEQAAQWVQQKDQERARFVKDHFGKDAGDPLQYDLVLNSSRFSPAECADIIVESLHVLQTRAAAAPVVPAE